MTRLGHSSLKTTNLYLQSLGFTNVNYTESDRPAYLSAPTQEELAEAEQLSQAEDAQLAALLARKIGPKLAQEVVYGVPSEKTIKKLKDLGLI